MLFLPNCLGSCFDAYSCFKFGAVRNNFPQVSVWNQSIFFLHLTNRQANSAEARYLGSVSCFFFHVCLCTSWNNWKIIGKILERNILWALTREFKRLLEIHTGSLSPLLQMRSENAAHFFRVPAQVKIVNILVDCCQYLCSIGNARHLWKNIYLASIMDTELVFSA